MRLVEQVTLSFREGKSDKIYQVDLCELGPDQFVVNFRYGRRGSKLRDGTKTESPVGEAKARAIFDKLVASKENKGYNRGAADAAPAAPTQSTPDRSSAGANAASAARRAALLSRLGQGTRGDQPIDRVIWRVGELGVREAEPLLLELLSAAQSAKRETKSEVSRIHYYSLLWALGRCGSSAATSGLQEFLRTLGVGSSQMLRIIAEEAVCRLDDSTAKTLRDQLVGGLPAGLRTALSEGNADKLQGELRATVERRDESASSALIAAYRLRSEIARPGLISVLRDAPLVHGVFRAIRVVFKLAEFWRDAEVFGLLAYRFETTTANWSDYHETNRTFGANTRGYLRRRVGRTLRRLGEMGSGDYVKMAVGSLLPFTDDDAQDARHGVYETWNYDSDHAVRSSIRWDRFAGYWGLNTILYGRSPRYGPDKNGRAWRCRGGYEPGQDAPTTREESFPELWEAAPEALLHLIDDSRCLPVHEMAAKALATCNEFCASLDSETVAMILRSSYDVSARLGFELAKQRQVDAVLIAALAECRLQESRTFAHSWLRKQLPAYADTTLWARLITSQYTDNREFARGQLRVSAMSAEDSQLVIGRVIAIVKSLEAEDSERIADATRILSAVFPTILRTIGEEVIRDLLAHPVLVVQEFGADLLLGHDRLARQVPGDLLIALLDSEHASIRTVGTKLLDQLPDSELLAHPDLLIHLVTHALEDLRLGCRGTIVRLAGIDAGFARRMASELADSLTRKLPKGVPADVLALLKAELSSHLPPADRDTCMALIRARSPYARELAGVYLAKLEPDEFELFDLITLSNNEILSVREASWDLCARSVDRFRVGMPALAKLLDSSWADSREFALAFVRKHFGEDQLGPEVLIAICDSVRPEIQQFGRDLIVKNFRDEDGRLYLARLSEHPAVSLQLFVTNYLERYASGDAGRLDQLAPYFLSVLSRVNKGGVAKRRCLAFLAAEGVKSREAASVVGRILTRQSVTIAIGNKASCIEAMIALQAAFPNLELPIVVRKPEVRRAV